MVEVDRAPTHPLIATQVRLTFLQCVLPYMCVLKEPASQEANVEAAPTEHQLCPAHEPRPRSAHGANYTLLSG